MEDPKLSILETYKTLKVNRGGDGSPSCRRISDFMIFIKVIIAIWDVNLDHGWGVKTAPTAC